MGWAFQQAAAQPNNPKVKEVMKVEKVSLTGSASSMASGATIPLTFAKNFEDYIFDLMTHGDYDDYWKAPDMNWSLNYATDRRHPDGAHHRLVRLLHVGHDPRTTSASAGSSRRRSSCWWDRGPMVATRRRFQATWSLGQTLR